MSETSDKADHDRDMQQDRELREQRWREQGLCDLCGLRHGPDCHE